MATPFINCSYLCQCRLEVEIEWALGMYLLLRLLIRSRTWLFIGHFTWIGDESWVWFLYFISNHFVFHFFFTFLNHGNWKFGLCIVLNGFLKNISYYTLHLWFLWGIKWWLPLNFILYIKNIFYQDLFYPWHMCWTRYSVGIEAQVMILILWI